VEIKAQTGDEAYHDLLAHVHDHGEVVAPRGHKTWEVQDATITFKDPFLAPPVNTRTGFNDRIAVTELLHLLAGVSHLGQLDVASNGQFTQFSDSGRLRGAYGPRLFHQLPRVEAMLRRDPDTRQAVAVIWTPHEVVTHDVPCTVSLAFLNRGGKLCLKVHMRSNDLMLGIPYDWYVFSRVQLVMAEVLDLEPGTYTHHADSLHLYERDEDRAGTMFHRASVRDTPTRVIPAFTHGEVFGYGEEPPLDTWERVQSVATEVLWHQGITNWFTERVQPLTGDDVICPRCQYVVHRAQLVHTTDMTLMDEPARCLECWAGD